MYLYRKNKGRAVIRHCVKESFAEEMEGLRNPEEEFLVYNQKFQINGSNVADPHRTKSLRLMDSMACSRSTYTHNQCRIILKITHQLLTSLGFECKVNQILIVEFTLSKDPNSKKYVPSHHVSS